MYAVRTICTVHQQLQQQQALLPLHYFVHSFGSPTRYALKAENSAAIKGSGFTHMECNYGDMFPDGWIWAQGFSEKHDNFTDSSSLKNSRNSQQSATQIQPNTILSEATSLGTCFVMTGGKFKIGPVSSKNWVIGYRSAGRDWNFRTTDLDAITASVLSYDARRVAVRATSRDKTRCLEVSSCVIILYILCVVTTSAMPYAQYK
jgi:hypothetical protein